MKFLFVPPMVRHRFAKQTLLLIVLTVWASSIAAHAATHRVALNEFSTTVDSWDAMQAAEAIPTALQGLLRAEPGIEWVERAALGLVFQEKSLGSSASESIRRARLAKADWSISGRFVLTKDGRYELILEAIDLAHADVLAEQRVPMMSLKVAEVGRSLPGIAAGVRSLLAAAAKRETEVAGKTSIAVLFFPELESFEQEFQAALEDPQRPGGGFRLLHLPRSRIASNEAELVLGGFTDDQPGTWRSIADAYVWGSMKKRKAGEFDAMFDEAPLADGKTPDIDLRVWDGRLSPVVYNEESEAVAPPKYEQALRAQARRLADSVAAYVRQPRTGEVDETQRIRVARSLLRTADELEDNGRPFGGSMDAPEGRRRYLNLVQTLESACFLDPQNAAAQARLIQVRFGRLTQSNARNGFRFQMGRREAWGRFVERFGVAGGPPSPSTQLETAMRESAGFAEISRLMSRVTDNQSVVQEFIGSACEAYHLGTLGNREDFGFPTGFPEALAGKWEDAFAREVARRLLVASKEPEADHVRALAIVFQNRGRQFYSIPDAVFRVKFLEQRRVTVYLRGF